MCARVTKERCRFCRQVTRHLRKLSLSLAATCNMNTNPLLETIEPDEPLASVPSPSANTSSSSNGRPVVLTPAKTYRSSNMTTSPGDAESGSPLQIPVLDRDLSFIS
jgi:hypothetical protein